MRKDLTQLNEAALITRLDPASNFHIVVPKETTLQERIRLRFGLSGREVSITELSQPCDYPRYEIRVVNGQSYAG